MDNLRLILFISGILIIAAIYVWEVLRGRQANARARHEEQDVLDDASPLYEGEIPGESLSLQDPPKQEFQELQDPPKQESPKNSPLQKEEPHTDTEYWDRMADEVDDKVVLGDLDALDSSEDKTGPVTAPEGLTIPAADAVEDVAEIAAQPAAERNFFHSFGEKLRSNAERLRVNIKGPRVEKAIPPNREPFVQSPMPRERELVITLTIMAKPGARFSGAEIREQFEKAGMHFGYRQIYHHFGMVDQQTEQPVFSAADILEPGTFKSDNIDDHSTKGLILFMQLPGPLDGLVAFELMLSVAQQLAKSLDGSLCDETRSTLTTQAANHLRERIEELKRKQLV
uniref:Cell division protein ZipA n=1 Tax=Candidatus Kentrum sp. MB TaxID=2138164 RepID=A0A450XBS3_9GAMM|nr:MAG: cell division protein ZipA [Candidatus Kentron sp. MB]VFK31578.1 MAG: cell division protein ZipA [Candidatus Kentron sp. MB]VFK75888.1 MAG: cell division protein ZipA [Candidatus Kentron sp. MB]